MNKMTPADKISKSRIALMAHPATMQYSGILMIGSHTLTYEVPTAATNGRDVMYNPDFIEQLNHQEIAGLILHEAGHVMYQHGYLWSDLFKEDPDLANQAADYVINIEISDLQKKHRDLIALPEGALLDEKFRGWSTLEVYKFLKKNGNGGKGGKGFDQHDFGKLTGTEAEELSREVDNAIRQGALLAGKLGGDSQHVAEFMEPKIDWRGPLEDFICDTQTGKDSATWSRLNRRWIGQGIVMPSSITETMGPLVVVIDSSGSIVSDKELLSSFMAHVRGMCQSVTPSILHLLECDSKVQVHDTYVPETYHTLGNKTVIKGGGGTDMCAALEYVEANNLKPDAIVVLTDGWTPFPNTLKYPTMWAITTKGITAPAGRTIHVD